MAPGLSDATVLASDGRRTRTLTTNDVATILANVSQSLRQDFENHISFNKIMRNLPVKTPEDDANRQRRRKRKARVLILPYLYGSQADLVN